MPHWSLAAWQLFSFWYMASAAIVVFGLFTFFVVRGMRRQAPQLELIRGGRPAAFPPERKAKGRGKPGRGAERPRG
ncbi:MAG: hypothetical protein IRZ26_04260 [Clostridia bacterium]|nr:hypothetical protein [Clostridia bacterium]MCL6522823.1 hypothetical protein [Bacillota bacterium]